jgi:hypothetical protein
MGITMLNNLVFTPYPNLNYYKTLVKENRLITKEAKYYNGYTVVHRPKNIHPADLQEAVIKMHQKFYSPRSMFKRMIKHNVLKFPEFLIWNRLWGTKNYEVIPGVDVNKWMNYLRTL